MIGPKNDTKKPPHPKTKQKQPIQFPPPMAWMWMLQAGVKAAHFLLPVKVSYLTI